LQLLVPIPFCICLANRHATATGCAPCVVPNANKSGSVNSKSDSNSTTSKNAAGCSEDTVLALVSVHVVHGKNNGSRELSGREIMDYLLKYRYTRICDLKRDS
jgi:hypothetical protein